MRATPTSIERSSSSRAAAPSKRWKTSSRHAFVTRSRSSSPLRWPSRVDRCCASSPNGSPCAPADAHDEARPACHTPWVDIDQLTVEERAWVERDEAIWRRAHAIVAPHTQLDVSDVYHALVNLQRSPAERLARGLAHGRLRPR